MPPRRRSRALGLLLVFAALLFVLTSAHPLHVHGADRPGLYDGECPLAEVAAPRGAAVTAPTPAALWVGRLSVEPPTKADARVKSAPAFRSALRAPPLV
ncbi:MAG TPA: hypothetical protein VEH80_05880 [Candidatus Bathyarchaeia archaeon]|nr:hypothetical protein [Candidatus Bathyarchaeia archaeon]